MVFMEVFYPLYYTHTIGLTRTPANDESPLPLPPQIKRNGNFAPHAFRSYFKGAQFRFLLTLHYFACPAFRLLAQCYYSCWQLKLIAVTLICVFSEFK